MAQSAGASFINITLGLNTEPFQKGFSEAITKVQEFEKKINSMAKSAGASLSQLGLPSTFGQTFSASIESMVNFEAAMRNINTIAGMNDEGLKSFSDTILTLNDRLNSTVGPVEAAKAAYEILSSGFENTADAQKILEASMIAGTAGMSDANVAAKAITGILNSYQMSADKAGQVSDVMFNAVKYGTVTFEELAKTLGRVAPTAAAAGVSFEEVVAAITTLTTKGIRATEATTGVKRALVALTAPTDQANKALAEMGITAEMLQANLASKGPGGGLVGTMELLMKATGGNREVLRKLLGEATALNATFALAGDSAGDMFQRISGHMTDANASMEAFQEQSKSIKVQFEQMKANAESAGVGIGNIFAPAIHLALRVVNDFMKGLIHAGEGLSMTKDALVSFFSGVPDWALLAGTAIGSLVLTFQALSVAAGEVSLVGAAFAAASTPIVVAAEAIATFVAATNPLILIGGAVAAGVVAATVAYQDNAKEAEKNAQATEQLGKALWRMNQARRAGQDKNIKNPYANEAELLEDEKSALQAAGELVNQAREKYEKFMQDHENASVISSLFGDPKKEAQKLVELANNLKLAEDNYKKVQANNKKSTKTRNENEERDADIKQRERDEEIAANRHYYNEITNFKMKRDDDQFDHAKDALAELHRIQKENFNMSSDSSVIAMNEEVYRLEREFAKKARDEKKKNDKAFFDEEMRRKIKEYQGQYDSLKITYSQYKTHLEAIAALYKSHGHEYAAEAETLEQRVAKAKIDLDDNVAKIKKQNMDRLYQVSVKDLERRVKLNQIDFKQQADALKKMSEDTRYSEEQRASLKEKAGQAMSNQANKNQKDRSRQIKADQELLKENMQTAEEELNLEKRKAEAGMISATTFQAAMKKTYEMKRKALELDTMKEANAAKGDKEVLQDIMDTYDAKLRQLNKEEADATIKALMEIKKAKGENIAKTQEQIDKEKEYLNLLKTEGKGALLSVEEFAKQMNTRWEGTGEQGPIRPGQAFNASGFGEQDKRKAIEKEIKDRRAMYNQIGYKEPRSMLDEWGNKKSGFNAGVFDAKGEKYARGITGDQAMLNKFEASLNEAKKQTAILERIDKNGQKHLFSPGSETSKSKDSRWRNGSRPTHK